MLKKLWADGLSASQIAAELGGGITRNAVIGKVHRLGLSGRVKASPPKQRRVPTPRRKRSEIIYSRFAGPVCEADPVEIKDEDIPLEQRKKLLELTNETCRWPVGDPSNPEFYFCGATPFFDHPYCAAHCEIAYQPPASRPARKKDTYREMPKNPARRFAA
jgi:GcrA cell cycle regulator